MVTIEIANPIQIVMVIAEPRTDAGALAATNAENCGESAAAINPQKSINAKKWVNPNDQMNGEIKQQIPDAINAVCATRLLPI